jgi:hypothetical protein
MFQAARGLAANTIEAYGRDLDRYLGFLETENIPFHSVIRPTVGAYIRSITQLFLLTVGRWLAAKHPTITTPEQWDRNLAVECLTMITNMRCGDFRAV